MQSLRDVLGPEPSDSHLHSLLSHHGGDVSAAADAWFRQAEPQPEPIAIATPVARPPPPPAAAPSHLSVMVPAGLAGGAEIHVQAPDGALLRAIIPPGLTPGNSFLVRMPDAAPPPAHYGIPVQSGAPQPQPQPQRVIVHHHHGSRRYAHAQPYYGGGFGAGYGYPQYDPYCRNRYGYGYDPVLPAAAGLLGGLLIADAFFW